MPPTSLGRRLGLGAASKDDPAAIPHRYAAKPGHRNMVQSVLLAVDQGPRKRGAMRDGSARRAQAVSANGAATTAPRRVASEDRNSATSMHAAPTKPMRSMCPDATANEPSTAPADTPR
jgi:hypothetical protein